MSKKNATRAREYLAAVQGIMRGENEAAASDIPPMIQGLIKGVHRGFNEAGDRPAERIIPGSRPLDIRAFVPVELRLDQGRSLALVLLEERPTPPSPGSDLPLLPSALTLFGAAFSLFCRGIRSIGGPAKSLRQFGPYRLF